MLLRDFITCNRRGLWDAAKYSDYESPIITEQEKEERWDSVPDFFKIILEPDPAPRPQYGEVFALFFVQKYQNWYRLSRRNLARWKRKNPELYEAIVEQSKGMFA